MVTKEQVKKCLDKYANDYLSTREETECFDYAIKAVDAYNERNEGFWDVYTDCEGKRTYYTCPFCKNKTSHFMYEPKYCDKCGARLKIEGSETDAE